MDLEAAQPALSGKVALVTGGASGIGLATARLLAGRGAVVGIADNRAEALDEACSSFPDGSRVIPLTADNRLVPDIEAAVSRLVAAAGGLDILVNNAGVSGRSLPIEHIDEAAFSQMFDTHVKGAFFYTRSAVAVMKRRRYGRIVNIASHFAMVGHDSMSHYVGAKGALMALTRAWAREFAPFDIRVNSVAPGLVATPMTEGSLGSDEIARRGKSALLGRVIQPEEIAYAVAWLVGPEAEMVTGQLISPNAGMALVGI